MKRQRIKVHRSKYSGVIALDYLLVLVVGLIISFGLFGIFVSALQGIYAFFSLVVRGNFL